MTHELAVHLAVDAAPAIVWGFLDRSDWQRSLNGLAAFDALDKQIGKAQSLTCPQLSFAWGVNADGTPKYQRFYAPRLQADFDRGRLSVLTWMQMNGGVLADGKTPARTDPGQLLAFNNESVLAGKHDAYLHQWAADAAAYGHKFVCRLNPEFNGWWEGPFAEYDATGKLANGNSDGSFVRAWRYIVDLVRPIAPNVLWFWCANPLSSTPGQPTYTGKLAHFYPGDGYVDFVGYDLYNKAGVDGSPWLTFQQTLEGGPSGWPPNSMLPMLAVAPGKPWMIGELGCGATAKAGDITPGAGDRPAWIRAMLDTIRTRYPFITAIQWYNVAPYTLGAADFAALGESLDDSWPGAPLPDPEAGAYRVVATPDMDAQIAQLQQDSAALTAHNAQLDAQLSDALSGVVLAQSAAAEANARADAVEATIAQVKANLQGLVQLAGVQVP